MTIFLWGCMGNRPKNKGKPVSYGNSCPAHLQGSYPQASPFSDLSLSDMISRSSPQTGRSPGISIPGALTRHQQATWGYGDEDMCSDLRKQSVQSLEDRAKEIINYDAVCQRRREAGAPWEDRGWAHASQAATHLQPSGISLCQVFISGMGGKSLRPDRDKRGLGVATPFDYIHYFISGSCFSLSPLKAVYHSLQMWCKVATFEE